LRVFTLIGQLVRWRPQAWVAAREAKSLRRALI
jgi:hypothetical protein